MTKKELAIELYDLYIQTGVLQKGFGCGKDEWVRRTLNGCGCVRGATKPELEFEVACARAELKMLMKQILGGLEK